MKLQIGDKIVEVDRVENNIPVIKATSEKIVHPDGRVDIKIYVPYLNLNAKKED